MASENIDKAVQFVAKLVQLTQDGEVRWQTPAFGAPDVDAVSSVFTTNIDGRNLRIYKKNREVTITETKTEGFFQVRGSRKSFAPTAVLEVVDDFGQVSYVFDKTTGLDDLFESASFSASRVDELMNSVLNR